MVIPELMSTTQSPNSTEHVCGAVPGKHNTHQISQQKQVVVWSHSLLAERAGWKGANPEMEGSDFWVGCVSGLPGWREEGGWQGWQSLMVLE